MTGGGRVFCSPIDSQTIKSFRHLHKPRPFTVDSPVEGDHVSLEQLLTITSPM